MHYMLKLTIKRIVNNIKEGKEEKFKFNLNISCTFGYKLLARYSLPLQVLDVY